VIQYYVGHIMIMTSIDSGDDDVIMPEGPPPGTANNDEEDSDDDIPMPPGPPPGQSLPQGLFGK
jgi:hypothetical protein